MHNQNMKKLASIIAALTITATNVVAGDFNAAIGNFDYSDKGKSAAMLELTYGFTEKNIDTKIGTINQLLEHSLPQTLLEWHTLVQK
jgi:hypothetical protein